MPSFVKSNDISSKAVVFAAPIACSVQETFSRFETAKPTEAFERERKEIR